MGVDLLEAWSTEVIVCFLFLLQDFEKMRWEGERIKEMIVIISQEEKFSSTRGYLTFDD